eukprot:c1551_g1_i1.p1 GENE.c1551_g1_i1~~c1551_g1_i1.p1  ORF type:complete len:282 (+),score=61.75 c1551_g1_i1:816-1661(+)
MNHFVFPDFGNHPIVMTLSEWKTAKGSLRKVGDTRQWLEYSKDGTHTFTFHERTVVSTGLSRHVILHDSQRNKYVKLMDTGMYWSDDGLEWKYLTNGQFAGAPTPSAFTQGLVAMLAKLLPTLLFIGLFAAAIQFSVKSEVETWTADDLDKLDSLASFDKPHIVDFYAPWCPHCKEMAPVWEDLAHVIGDRVKVIKVDCDKESRAHEKQSIAHYPTIRLFMFGKEPIDYNGVKEADQIIHWLISQGALPQKFTYDKEYLQTKKAERQRLKAKKSKEKEEDS